jgi:hypothetical protein
VLVRSGYDDEKPDYSPLIIRITFKSRSSEISSFATMHIRGSERPEASMIVKGIISASVWSHRKCSATFIAFA